MNNIALIPVRSGSTRLKLKALEEIEGETLLSITLKKATNSHLFDEVVCLGDSAIFQQIAEKNNVSYYQRSDENASNNAKSDEVILEAINKIKPDNIYWLNLTHPFTSLATIQKVVQILDNPKSKTDSVFTTHSWLSHASFSDSLDQPINYDFEHSFSQTQSMKKIVLITYGIMAWNASAFLERYHSKGAAMLNGKVETVNVSRLESIWIKNQEDIDMVRSIISKDGLL